MSIRRPVPRNDPGAPCANGQGRRGTVHMDYARDAVADASFLEGCLKWSQHDTEHGRKAPMEQVPGWLNDAVAAAGIAGVYVEFDTMHPANGEGDPSLQAPPATH